ncbi:MAG TPA: hypothetical protein VG095_10635, partial [Chthoniobacterales bacterium]|nr:hypothetical protein [Chthoniobacterales bacterium]
MPLPRLLLAQLIGCCLFTWSATAQPPAPGEESTPKPTPAGDVVDYTKLLPILPEPPDGWKADEAEGSTDDMGEAQISTVHRDYSKGDTPDAPTTSISILDSVASPEYVDLTTAGWTRSETTPEGYTKSVTIEGMPGFETFETDGKHGTLWLLVAKRYFLQIETTGQDPPALEPLVQRRRILARR